MSVKLTQHAIIVLAGIIGIVVAALQLIMLHVELAETRRVTETAQAKTHA